MVKTMTSWSVMGNGLLVMASSWALPETGVVSRQLMTNQTGSSRSMEKLSSGLRINRAGDDAAGLAISEKMRGQIRGLNQASRNAQDGISLIQTAEGALNETHSILQRMRELAVQSASDTNTKVDRGEIQKEIDQLAQELTRIADTTEFNTQNLLGGGLDVKFHIGANSQQNIQLAINNMSGEALKVAFEEAATVAGTATSVVDAGQTYTVIRFDAVTVGTTSTVDSAQYGWVNADGDIVAVSADGKTYTELAAATALGDLGTDVEASGSTFDFGSEVASGTVSVTTGDSGELVVTARGGINVSEQDKADAAITTINNAIETVSAERSKLGAMQNRLEHTIANLGASAENLQAAESRIRDVDMAAEMMAFTKFQILQQASTAMLAQANMAPQSVLQLLG